jgi:hypothetical protein
VRAAALLLLAAALAGCGTPAGIRPEDKVVTSVTSLPPVDVPVPVRCLKKPVPPIPSTEICGASCTPLQRYYQMEEAILAYERYAIDVNGMLIGCAGRDPPKEPQK